MKTSTALATAKMETDTLFRRVAAGSTALGFATALGSTACLELGNDRNIEFHWHWIALPFMALGVAAALHLWQLIWTAAQTESKTDRARLSRFVALIAVGGLATFAYPIRFVTSSHLSDVLGGLLLAAAVLSFTGWMIHRVGSALLNEDQSS